MFCKECGTQLSDDAQFCPNCGKEVVSSMSAKNTASSPPKKKSVVVIGVGVALILIAIIGIFFITGNRSDKNATEETIEQGNIAVQESTETVTDIPQSSVAETVLGKEYPFYAASLITLINEQSLPSGEIIKYISDPESNPLKFAICDINKDGKEELLLNLPYDTCEVSGHFIYTENVENTGLENLCRFNEDTIYYGTGFIKEPVSYGGNLSVNFNPYNIRMWDAGGFLDVGRVEAWEKSYMASDFSGNAFPDSVDTDGNGTVYFISGELGIDYNNPVDDAEYREYEKQFFDDGQEIHVPWLELTVENIENTTGYTEERITTENIVPIYTGEIYDNTLSQFEADLPEEYEQIPYVPITIDLIGMEYETYLSNIPERIELPTDYLQARFSSVFPLLANTTETTYYGYYEKGIVQGVNDIYMIGSNGEGYITTFCFSPQDTYFDMNVILDEMGDTTPYIAYSDVRDSLLIWRLDNAYLIMAVAAHYSNGELVPTRMTSMTIAQEINGKWLGIE